MKKSELNNYVATILIDVKSEKVTPSFGFNILYDLFDKVREDGDEELAYTIGDALLGSGLMPGEYVKKALDPDSYDDLSEDEIKEIKEMINSWGDDDFFQFTDDAIDPVTVDDFIKYVKSIQKNIRNFRRSK